jgi:hypothetical protein
MMELYKAYVDRWLALGSAIGTEQRQIGRRSFILFYWIILDDKEVVYENSGICWGLSDPINGGVPGVLAG